MIFLFIKFTIGVDLSVLKTVKNQDTVKSGNIARLLTLRIAYVNMLYYTT